MPLAWSYRCLTKSESRTIGTLYPTAQCVPHGSIYKSIQRLISRTKAPNTMASYGRYIKQWTKFADENGFPTNPAKHQHLCIYIASMADEKKSLSDFLKLGPALTLLHSAQVNKEINLANYRIC